MIDYKNKTTNKEDYGNLSSYDNVIDCIADLMMYDILEDIERGLKDGCVHKNSDIVPEEMVDWAWEVFENYIWTELREKVLEKLEKEMSEHVGDVQ